MDTEDDVCSSETQAKSDRGPIRKSPAGDSLVSTTSDDRATPSATDAGKESSRGPSTVAGDRRNVGGRPTGVELAARDPRQQRLSFASSSSPQQKTGLLIPPAAASKAKAATPAPMSEMDVALKAVREGRGESLTKKQMLALLVGLLSGDAAPQSGGEAGKRPSTVETAQRSEDILVVAEKSAQKSPVGPSPGVHASSGRDDAGVGEPRIEHVNVFVGPPVQDQMIDDEVGREVDANVPAAEDGWQQVPAQSKRKNTAPKPKPGPQVSSPKLTHEPKRVVLKVAPPKARPVEGDKTTPDTKVVFDGIPPGTTFLGFSRILDRFYRSCAALTGSDFPIAPVTTSTHLLGQGGWVVSYREAEMATKVLAQDPAILAEAAEIDVEAADIHRPGALTRKGERMCDKASRSIFMHLEPTLLGEIWDEVRAALRKDIEDPQWASYGIDPKGKQPKPAIPTIAAHRVLLEEALMRILRAPAGSKFERIQILGSTGAIIGLLSSAEGAACAIAEGIQAPELARSIVARMALSPDQRGGLAFCTRCLGVGHRPHQCDQRPRCRSCGGSGHPESNGQCPKQKRHPSQPKGGEPFCVLCGMAGHKAGAPSCVEMKRTRKSLSKGPDGTYADAVKAVRAARVEAAKTTLNAVAASRPTNSWSNPLQVAGEKEVDRVVSSTPTGQFSLKIDRLERALLEMQSQMSMMMQVIMAGHSSPQTTSQVDLVSQVQEDDRLITSSLSMRD